MFVLAASDMTKASELGHSFFSRISDPYYFVTMNMCTAFFSRFHIQSIFCCSPRLVPIECITYFCLSNIC